MHSRHQLAALETGRAREVWEAGSYSIHGTRIIRYWQAGLRMEQAQEGDWKKIIGVIDQAQYWSGIAQESVTQSTTSHAWK